MQTGPAGGRELLQPEEWERVSQELALLDDEERQATEF
jgi:hypothetical protein